MAGGPQEPGSPETEVQLARLTEQMISMRGAFDAERTSSKEAIAAAFKAAETATAAALQAQKESADKSEKNAEKQLEMHNGLIRKMDVMVQNFPTKESVDEKIDAVDERLASRDERINGLDKAVSRAYGVAVGAVAVSGLISAVVAIVSQAP